MKLKFKQQQYQEDAVMSVVHCFDGQKREAEKICLLDIQKHMTKGLY